MTQRLAVFAALSALAACGKHKDPTPSAEAAGPGQAGVAGAPAVAKPAQPPA
ncbi:MAG: hypothetical protein HOV81_13180, partial [Kofleriaceae bacterium]|nr:hypothetical protein [Kofleriaceae bacterium]